MVILIVTELVSVKVARGTVINRIKTVVRNVIRAGAVVVTLNAFALLIMDVVLLVIAIWAIKAVAIAVFVCAPLFLVSLIEYVVALLMWSATVPLDDNFPRGP